VLVEVVLILHLARVVEGLQVGLLLFHNLGGALGDGNLPRRRLAWSVSFSNG
jgi:hypothetical protein